MNKLVITLATRNRPQQVVETIQRSTVNLVLDNTVFIVQVDEDDKPTIEALSKAPLDKRVRVNIAPREDTIAEKWNRGLSEPADVYKTAADDDPYVTPGYDALILKAAKVFPDGIGTVYGHMANLSFTGVSAPTAKMCEKLGYIFPPLFAYWFVDHWVDDVFRMIGRITFADVRTDQSRAGKTQEMREPAWWATFFDACYLMRRRQAHAIIDAPDFSGEPWHKELLKNGHVLIEERSRGINESVRQNARNLEGYSGLTLKDARYLRLREKAAGMVPFLLDDREMPDQEKLWFRNILLPPTVVPGLKRAWA